MSLDRRYRKDENAVVRAAVVLGVVSGVLVFILWWVSGPDEDRVDADQVWSFISQVAPAEGLDPEFVYALAWAESSLNARAKTSVARGMMQISRPAWSDVSDLPYACAWDWQTNIRVSVDYLNLCRDFLVRHESFSYPLLAAAYRYGPTQVKRSHFRIENLPRPKNEIYKKIFEGNTRPVAPPISQSK